MSSSPLLTLCLVTFCCSLFFLAKTKAYSTFPADIPRCHSGDTDCVIRTAINLIRQRARSGYPAAAFPIIEPFHLKEFDINDGRGGSINLKLSFRDVDVVGLSGVNIDRAVGFGANPSTSKFEMYGSFPKVTITGKYKADGRILILPIRGEGNADIILENSKISFKFKPSCYSQNGKTYLMVDKLKVLIEPEKMNIKLTNLFNGDQALGFHMNQFLNENWFDVWSELQPSVQKAIAEVAKSIMTPIFQKFAYEDLYADLHQ